MTEPEAVSHFYGEYNRITASENVDHRWYLNPRAILEELGLPATVGHKLVRISAKKPWGPGNARWRGPSSASQVATLIVINGIAMMASEWSTDFGIPLTTLLGRVQRGVQGMELVAPSKRGRPPRSLTINGTTRTLQEWSLRTGVPESTIRARIDRGWRLEEAVSANGRRRWRPRHP